MDLILGVLTLSFGVYALIKGRLQLSKKYVLEGNSAKIAGLLLVAAPITGLIFSLNGLVDSAVFNFSCWGIIGVLIIAAFQIRKPKQEDAAAREDFEARYGRKNFVTDQKQKATEPAVAGIGSEEIKTTLNAHPDLTGEERKVLELILSGRQNLEIADELRISPIHASLLQSQLREKFRAETNEELIKLVLQQG